MTDVDTVGATPKEPELLGPTVVVIGGSVGLREACDAGDWSPFHGWDRRARPHGDGASA